MTLVAQTVLPVLLCTAGEAPDYGTDGVIPEGYDGDRCHPNALAECRVENGTVIVPGGVRYRVVGTPPRGTLRPEVDAAFRRLEEMGATVVEYGEVAATLKRLGCVPDFTCDDHDVRWIHRQVGEDDVYFVAVPNKKPERIKCSFRVGGKVPELWDPLTGEIESIDRADIRTVDGRTEISRDCAPAHSAFVVFRKKPSGCARRPGASLANLAADDAVSFFPVKGSWHVTFREPGEVADVAAAEFETLASWTESANGDIRYFSGTATYRTTVPSPSVGGRRVVLDLGNVKNIAEVTVNGKAYPTLWKPPFAVDVTDAVKPGDAIELEIKVTNYWPNRLIGDAQLPDDCEWDDGRNAKGFSLVKTYPDWLLNGRRSPSKRHAFSTCRLWRATDPLHAAGLLGPVRIALRPIAGAGR